LENIWNFSREGRPFSPPEKREVMCTGTQRKRGVTARGEYRSVPERIDDETANPRFFLPKTQNNNSPNKGFVCSPSLAPTPRRRESAVPLAAAMDALPRDIASVRFLMTRFKRETHGVTDDTTLAPRSRFKSLPALPSDTSFPIAHDESLVTHPPSLPSPNQVLPEDPGDQLELAHRIANAAFVKKTLGLEQEVSALREENAEGKMRNKQLERKLQNAEHALSDASEKAALAMEDRETLLQEKQALINTVKKLNKDVAKLEHFKRNLMRTLADDDENAAVGDFGDASSGDRFGDASGDRLINSVLSNFDATRMRSPGARSTYAEDGRGERNVRSTHASPAPSSRFDGNGSSAPSSPLNAKPPPQNKVDGKEFFRKARSRLSYEHFSQFLQNIKELNAHKQTRAETLKKASDIFGDANDDLYKTFETLLVKHLPK
jgi:hypothetical protein